MTRNLKKIVHEFYEEMGRAYRTKELNPDKLHLDDDAQLIGVCELFEGKQEILKAFNNLICVLQEQTVLHQYFDHESASTFCKKQSPIPEIYFQTSERIVVRNNRIIEINILYDALSWHKLIELLQNLSCAASFFKPKD